MQIDWFTVGAQILNFLLLVWLLKRYLYGPILKAVDARETHIAQVISEAETIKSDAELQRNLFEEKNIEIATKRDKLFKDAKNVARDESEKILIQAHKKADEISKSGLVDLEKELQHFQDDIALKTLQEIYEIVRKVLVDLADVELEQKMFECFCVHLRSIRPDQKTNLNNTVEVGNSELLLSSAFKLTAVQVEKIDTILKQIISTKTTNHYQLKHQVKTELISGIELRSKGWKIGWNAEDYLKVLQTHIEQLLASQRETLNSKIIRKTNLETTQLKRRLFNSENPA